MTSITQQFINLRPHGGFDLIVADPPWLYKNWSTHGTEKNAMAHYDCTPIEWIKALPVQILAADDCLCFLWATNPMLPEAMQVLDAWGFTFKTAGTWVKRSKHGKDAFGTGYIFRSSNEPIIIGTRGKPRTKRSTRSTVASYEDCDLKDFPNSVITIEAAIREHSRKPDEAFTAAEKLMPDAKRIELFSRQARKGWAAWGNQIDKFQEDAA